MKLAKGNTADRGLQALLTEMNKPGNYVESNSRNGPVRRFRGTATLTWTRPQYRVSFDPIRDANPAFHLFEALWMLNGENDVKRAAYFASQMGQYSDDGVTFHGGYGHRWVKHFGYDQIREYVIPALRKNSEDRRVVLGMWDPTVDIPAAQNNGKDVPCNLMCTFDATQGDGRLHLINLNRSNDSVWGATGANIVQFSMLQEYVASACDLGVGVYDQISSNMHLYLELNDVSKRMLKIHNDDPGRELPYFGMLSPLRHKSDGTAYQWQEKFDRDLNVLMLNYNQVKDVKFETYFFKYVVQPVIMAFNCYKNDDAIEVGMDVLKSLLPPFGLGEPWFQWHDWNIAMYKWLERVCEKRNAKVHAGLTLDGETFDSAVKAVWKNAEPTGDGSYTVGGSTQVASVVPKRFIAYRGLTPLTESLLKKVEKAE